MARITLSHLAHSYLANPRQRGRLRPQGARPRLARTAAPTRCSAPPAAARPRFSTSSPACIHPSQGRVLFGDRDVTDAADRGAQHRAGLPVPGRLRHDDGAREPRLPAAQPRRRRRPTSPSASQGIARMIGMEAVLDRKARGPDRRRQAEDQPRPRHGARGRQRHPLRRAADRHRPADEMGAPHPAQASSTASSATR